MKILSFSTLKTAFSAGIVVALLGTTVGCTVTPRHDGQRVYYPNGQHQGNGKYNNNGRYNNGGYKTNHAHHDSKKGKYKNENGHHKNKKGKHKKDNGRYNNNSRYDNNHYRYK